MKKSVLFVCIENSCRSQMAEGFARHYAGDKMDIYSAGSRPSGIVHPLSLKAMSEIGIVISKQHSKGFSDLPYDSFDYVVTMGCGDNCPMIKAKTRLDWQIPNPTASDYDFFKSVRDTIGEKVKELIARP